MKTPHNLYGKKLLPLLILLLLILSLFSVLSVNITRVSAVEYPAIMVVPEITMDLTPGTNFTVSIYTDYGGFDTTAYQFTLSYNPSVLKGVEVVNGDLITIEEHNSATFIAGTFNNTAGNLSLTVGFFKEEWWTAGPGTLANVTFTVVGYGTSNITLGRAPGQTALIGWWFLTSPHYEYTIIDAETMPDHIQHGFFANGGSIAGTVTDASTGEAIAGANVTANGMSTTTNSSGAYVIPNLPPGTYTVNASKTGYYSNSTAATVVTGETTTGIDFTLKLIVGWIDGYVTDNATIPIANATVTADTVASDTNNTGYYKIEIVPGTYTLTALMSGYYPHFIYNVSVSANETVTRNFTLERLPVTGWINGTVTDNATPPEPIEGATVTADVFLGFTDETGYYSIMVEAPRNYTVTASMSGYYDGVEYDVPVYENATTPVNFTLQLIVGWIDGYVTDANAGSAIVGANVTADGVSDLTDADGHYKIDVRPGDYAVNASKTGYYSNSTSVTVDPEKTTSVNFTLTPMPGAVAGRVTDASTGDPIKGATVEAAGPETKSTTTDADGHYLIADIPPGNYTVRVFAAAGYYEDSKSATVEPEKTTTLNFALQPKVGWINGTVTDALTGDPIYNATVTAAGYSTTTNIDGEYTIPADLLLGTYTVNASKTGYYGNSTSVRVYDKRFTSVDFALTPLPGAIAGTVTDASTGDPIVGASVTADGYSATTDADGHYNITDVPVGTYNVTAEATGYYSASKLATVESEKTTPVNFALRVNSTITISADPTTITVGDSTTISGSIDPTRKGVTVTIWYRISGEEVWTNLTTVTTNEYSQYSYIWTPETAGTYQVKASWLGDENTSPDESDVQPITVQEPPSGIPWYLYIAAAGVAAIIIAVTFYFLRIRKPKPT